MTKFNTKRMFMAEALKMLFPYMALIFFSRARSLSTAGSESILGFGW
jgi:hypothetical protein